jgi:hypothetical protein
MKLADLTKPQWDAARNAADCLMRGNPDREHDRAAYRASVTVLCALLPEGADEKEIIKAAAHWRMVNDIAASIAGIPA